MKPGDGNSELETLLLRAERLLAEMDRFPDGEPLYAAACDTIVTTVRDLAAEVSRLRDALRPLGLTTEDAIDESSERGRLMCEAGLLPDAKKPLAGYRIGVVDDEPD